MYVPNGMLKAIQPYTVNYRMNLLSVYDVEETDRYHSDLRLLFETLKHTEDGEDLKQHIASHEEYQKVNHLYNFLETYTT